MRQKWVCTPLKRLRRDAPPAAGVCGATRIGFSIVAVAMP
jgi:hypothetical protein